MDQLAIVLTRRMRSFTRRIMHLRRWSLQIDMHLSHSADYTRRLVILKLIAIDTICAVLVRLICRTAIHTDTNIVQCVLAIFALYGLRRMKREQRLRAHRLGVGKTICILPDISTKLTWKIRQKPMRAIPRISQEYADHKQQQNCTRHQPPSQPLHRYVHCTRSIISSLIYPVSYAQLKHLNWYLWPISST